MKNLILILAIGITFQLSSQKVDYEFFNHDLASTPVYVCGTEDEILYILNYQANSGIFNSNKSSIAIEDGTVIDYKRIFSKSKCEFSAANFFEFDVNIPKLINLTQDDSDNISFTRELFDTQINVINSVAINDSMYIIYNGNTKALEIYIAQASSDILLSSKVVEPGNFLKKSNTDLFFLTTGTLYRFDGNSFNEFASSNLLFEDVMKEWVYNEGNALFYTFSISGNIYHLIIENQTYFTKIATTIGGSRLIDVLLKDQDYYFIKENDPYSIFKIVNATHSIIPYFDSKDSIAYHQLSIEGENIIAAGISEKSKIEGASFAQKIINPDNYVPARVDLTFNLNNVSYDVVGVFLPYAEYRFTLDFSLTNNGLDTISHFDIWSNIATQFGASGFRYDAIHSIDDISILPGETSDFVEEFDYTTIVASRPFSFGVPGANYKYDSDQSDNFGSQDLALSSDDPAINRTINLFPNPTDGKVYIDHNLRILDVKVFDVLGNQLHHIGFDSKSIDLSLHPTGLYNIIIHTSQGQVYDKILKQ